MLEFKAPPHSNISPLSWSLVVEKKDTYAIYDGSNEANFVVYRAVVTPDTDHPVKITTLKKMCKDLQLMCPLDKYRSVVDGVNIATLLYPPFDTLNEYMARCSTEDPSFVEVMRGIIRGLNKLHINNYIPWILDENTMVVMREGKEGSLLAIHTTKEPTRSDSDCLADFTKVHTVINGLCSLEIARQRFNRPNWLPPPGLRTILDCMLLALTRPQRQRLLDAPFFYSEWDLVYGYISMMFRAIDACGDFKAELRGRSVIDRCPLVINDPHEEVTKVWHENPCRLNNEFAVFRFIRHCVEHLNERWQEVDITVRRNAQQQQYNLQPSTATPQPSTSNIQPATPQPSTSNTQPATPQPSTSNTQPPTRISNVSPLMLDPRLFLTDVVDRLFMDGLHNIFRLSYEVKDAKTQRILGTIPILDK